MKAYQVLDHAAERHYVEVQVRPGVVVQLEPHEALDLGLALQEAAQPPPPEAYE